MEEKSQFKNNPEKSTILSVDLSSFFLFFHSRIAPGLYSSFLQAFPSLNPNFVASLKRLLKRKLYPVEFSWYVFFY